MVMSRSEAGKLGYAKTREQLGRHRERQKEAARARWGVKNCPVCGVELPYEKRRHTCCSQACASVLRSKGVRRYRSTTRKKCLVCGAIIRRCLTYCSQVCHQEHRYRQYIQRWLVGTASGTTRKGYTSAYVRRWLLEQRGAVCWKCNWAQKNPVIKKVPLQVNHVDGRWANNRPENLELICPNCHSLTPTFGGLNRGRGRTHRYASIVQG